jgi:YggT family protein
MALILVRIIDLVVNTLVLLVIVDTIVSYLMDPYQPLRSFLDRIVNPLLAPIRHFVPPIGGLDLTPMIFIILLEILSQVLIRFVYYVL